MKNLALYSRVNATSRNRNLSISTYEGNVVDGRADTFWCSNSNREQWLLVSLNQTRAISEIRLTWKPLFYAKYFFIETLDEITRQWKIIYTEKNGIGDVVHIILDSPIEARHVRMRAIEKAIDTRTRYPMPYYALNEFAIFGVMNSQNMAECLSLNKSVRVSSVKNNLENLKGNNVTDGEARTSWESQVSNQEWIYVDLEKSKKIEHIILKWARGGGVKYDVQISDDAHTWQTIYTENQCQGDEDVITPAQPVSGRYVRMFGKNNQNTVYGYSLWEFIVLGEEGIEEDTTPTTQTIIDNTQKALVVEIFEHTNFLGNNQKFSVGNYGSLPNNWNDKISSLKIEDGYQIEVFEHISLGGRNKIITNDIIQLDAVFNDSISSFKIKKIDSVNIDVKATPNEIEFKSTENIHAQANQYKKTEVLTLDDEVNVPVNPQTISQQIIDNNLPTYNLMQRIKAKIINNTLVLNSELLGEYSEIIEPLSKILNLNFGISKVEFKFIFPGMETQPDPKKSASIAGINDTYLELSGVVKLWDNYSIKMTATFLYLVWEPVSMIKFEYADKDKTISFAGIPMISTFEILNEIEISKPQIIVTSKDVPKKRYDEKIKFPKIKKLLNFFGEFNLKNSNNEVFKFLYKHLHISTMPFHLAYDSSSKKEEQKGKSDKKTDTQLFVLEGFAKFGTTAQDTANHGLKILEYDNYSISIARADISITKKIINTTGGGADPTNKSPFTVVLSEDLIFNIKENEKEDTNLIFTGGGKFEFSPKGLIVTAMYTLNGTGKKIGDSKKQDVWEEPFGIKGFTIKQAALQIGYSSLGAFDNFGVAGDIELGDKEDKKVGKFAFLFDVTTQTDFVIAAEINKLTLIEIINYTSEPLSLTYNSLPRTEQETLNNILDVEFKKPEIYIVPTTCSIGKIKYEQGYSVESQIKAWGIDGYFKGHFSKTDLLTAIVEMDSISFEDYFSITGSGGKNNPILNLRIAPNEEHSLFISAKIYLLGLSQDVKITADKNGLNFDLSQDLNGTSQSLSGYYSNDNLSVSGKINFNINRTIPAIWGNITLNTNANIRIKIIANQNGYFSMSVNGSFYYNGINLNIPEFKISTPPNSITSVCNIIEEHIVNNSKAIFNNMFDTLDEYTKAVVDGMIQPVGDVSKLLKSYYASKDKYVDSCKKMSLSASKIAIGLSTYYYANNETIAKCLKTAGYDVNTIGSTLKSTCNISANSAAYIYKRLGYSVEITSGIMKNIFNISENYIVNILQNSNYTLSDTSNALKNIYKLSEYSLMSVMKKSTFKVKDLGAVYKNLYGYTQDTLTEKLKNVAYTAKDVSNVLISVYRANATSIIKSLKRVSYPAKFVASAIESVYNYNADRLANSLLDAGYDVTSVANSLYDIGNRNSKVIAGALEYGGSNIKNIAKILRNMSGLNTYNNTAATGQVLYDIGHRSASNIAEALKYSGSSVNYIGNALRRQLNFTSKVTAESLVKIGANSSEIANALKFGGSQLKYIAYALRNVSGLKLTSINTANLLYNIGFSRANDIAGALRYAGSTNEYVAKALKNVGYPVATVGKALKDVCGVGKSAMKDTLKLAGYASSSVSSFVGNTWRSVSRWGW